MKNLENFVVEMLKTSFKVSRSQNKTETYLKGIKP